MKKLLLSVILFLYLTAAIPVFAHMPGQPSFFIVNGKYAGYFKPPDGRPSQSTDPQDAMSNPYTTGQPLHFEIDTTKFPQANPEDIKRTKFIWNYGDGNNTDSGLKNFHTYTKPGSYTL